MAATDGSAGPPERTSVEWTFGCECGYVATGSDDWRLVADAQRHALDVHGMEMTTDLLLTRLRAARRRQDAPGSVRR